jgi:hypothetical protein
MASKKTNNKIVRNILVNKVSTTTPVSTEIPVETGASKIWNRIKDLPLEIYALPNQSVSDHVTRVPEMDKAFPDDLYVTIKSAAVYPALEETLGRVRLRKEYFDLSQSSKYIVIKIIPKV